MVIEGSISKILRSNEFSSMHPNAVFGTIQALAVRWGIQPWLAPTRAGVFRVPLHPSLEPMYSSLLLGHDIHASDLPMASSRHSIGICWRGDVHFDPWALVPPLACLSAGNLLKGETELEHLWDAPNSILSLIEEAKKADVRCRGCTERCTGGMRLAAMMDVLLAQPPICDPGSQ